MELFDGGTFIFPKMDEGEIVAITDYKLLKI